MLWRVRAVESAKVEEGQRERAMGEEVEFVEDLRWRKEEKGCG